MNCKKGRTLTNIMKNYIIGGSYQGCSGLTGRGGPLFPIFGLDNGKLVSRPPQFSAHEKGPIKVGPSNFSNATTPLHAFQEFVSTAQLVMHFHQNISNQGALI